eukprot:gene11148-12428_t
MMLMRRFVVSLPAYKGIGSVLRLCPLPVNQLITRQWTSKSSSLRFFSSGSSVLSEQNFHKISDRTLDEIQDLLWEHEEELEDVEIVLSQGVLTLTVGGTAEEAKSWVINKQTPNRQLWWSSPISGPRRYEYVDSASSTSCAEKWKYSRDEKVDLLSSLRDELEKVTGVKIL